VAVPAVLKYGATTAAESCSNGDESQLWAFR
jgi:hypothetical protein